VGCHKTHTHTTHTSQTQTANPLACQPPTLLAGSWRSWSWAVLPKPPLPSAPTCLLPKSRQCTSPLRPWFSPLTRPLHRHGSKSQPSVCPDPPCFVPPCRLTSPVRLQTATGLCPGGWRKHSCGSDPPVLVQTGNTCMSQRLQANLLSKHSLCTPAACPCILGTCKAR
jgi:hypothetical protein